MYEQSEHVKLIAQSAETWEKLLAEDDKRLSSDANKLPKEVRTIYQGFATILRVVHPAVAEQDLRLQTLEQGVRQALEDTGVEDVAAAIDEAVKGAHGQH